MNNIELLAPAGNMESLKSAILGGADAIYLGGKKYSARSFSNNFSLEEIKEAVDYAHLRNVSVYVAVNTIILESELNDCKQYINKLYKIGVDGIIVQDFGLLNYIVKNYDIEVHTSTQMSVDSVKGIKFMEEVGASRVVVARENSIEQIKEFRNQTNVCLEVFVSGALCVSYSGQCLISSFIGGRSGNRGSCSQICRKTYKLLNTKTNDIKETNGDYLLSLKDLMTLNDLEELLKLNNLSLKLEGRMKRSEYVYFVTSLYRYAINRGSFNNDDIVKLQKLFNRGFTKGFIFNDYSVNNKFRPNHIGVPIGKVIGINKGKAKIKLKENLYQGDGIRILGNPDTGLTVNRLFLNKLLVNKAIKDDICEIPVRGKVSIGSEVVKTTDTLLMNEISESIRNTAITNDIYIEVSGSVSSHLTGYVFDDLGNMFEFKSDFLIEESIKHKFDNDRFIKQLKKTKDYPFRINLQSINISPNSYVSIKQMNDFRRGLLEGFTKEKLNKVRNLVVIKDKLEIKVDLTEEIICSINTLDQYKACKELGIKTIYLRNLDLLNELEDVIPITPRMNDNLKLNGNYVASNYSRVDKYAVSTNFSLNVTNSDTVYSLHNKGIKRVCLSVELNKHQIKDIQNSFIKKYKHKANLEMIIYGYQEAMIMKYCPIASAHEIDKSKCNLCKNNSYSIIDSYNAEYKLINDNCITTMMYHKKLNLIDEVNEIKNHVTNIRMDFLDETYEDVLEVLNNLKGKLNGSEKNYFKDNDYKGHYYKGLI